MDFKSFDELIQKAQKCSVKKVVIVVSAEDEHTLEAVLRAKKTGILEPVLIGDKLKILEILNELGGAPEEKEITILDEKNQSKAAELAVKLINEKKGDFLMKGKIQTEDLLKVVVNKENGLRTGRVMSHIAIHEMKSYYKLLAVTDGGMNLRPNLEEKKQIIINAVQALNGMGIENPKIAVLSAVETVNPKMQETVDADALKKMNQSGEIDNCIIEGPISYDLAMSKESAEIKEYKSLVVEDADILVVPNIVSGNILGKSLVYSAGAKMAGMILGAKVPIVLTSRGSSSEEKYLSLVISACAANNNQEVKNK